MRLSEDTDTQRTSVNILPMIDVIFAILAFFILSTLYLTKAEGLPVNLPQAATATPQNQISATLTITPEGELFLGEAAIALEDLADEVRAIASANPIMVTVRADETTPHGRVVAAMDQLRTVEGVRLGIATVQP
ncbi:MAG: biopolymer transport protein ExbD [Phormidesmis priestleyi Ana]|uniref:Biopolymer transport protein ExbD n=1 Tax=Phormidesmis priestleyi Ana TaxID=1666911 RepID=A0A0N8KNF8_9CYAN|nr:MAG: biopolymer transport protein ExbD [Phormidesmis priestleyi Ana]